MPTNMTDATDFHYVPETVFLDLLLQGRKDSTTSVSATTIALPMGAYVEVERTCSKDVHCHALRSLTVLLERFRYFIDVLHRKPRDFQVAPVCRECGDAIRLVIGVLPFRRSAFRRFLALWQPCEIDIPSPARCAEHQRSL